LSGSPDTSEAAQFLNQVGYFLWIRSRFSKDRSRLQGQYAQVEPLLRRALAIREKVLFPEHPDVAASLNNLAELYVTLSEYEKAQPLYERALRIREKTLGSEHPDVAILSGKLRALSESCGPFSGSRTAGSLRASGSG
jgi:tetratricopeptide (TPR) repeat protein